MPIAVGREGAAALLSIAPSTFDDLVAKGRMPQPREIGRRVLWDTDEIRDYFRRIPRRGQRWEGNTWDDFR